MNYPKLPQSQPKWQHHSSPSKNPDDPPPALKKTVSISPSPKPPPPTPPPPLLLLPLQAPHPHPQAKNAKNPNKSQYGSVSSSAAPTPQSPNSTTPASTPESPKKSGCRETGPSPAESKDYSSTRKRRIVCPRSSRSICGIRKLDYRFSSRQGIRPCGIRRRC